MAPGNSILVDLLMVQTLPRSLLQVKGQDTTPIMAQDSVVPGFLPVPMTIPTKEMKYLGTKTYQDARGFHRYPKFTMLGEWKFNAKNKKTGEIVEMSCSFPFTMGSSDILGQDQRSILRIGYDCIPWKDASELYFDPDDRPSETPESTPEEQKEAEKRLRELEEEEERRKAGGK